MKNRIIALVLVGLLTLAPTSLLAQTSGDDIFLLTTSVSPNVILILDNSGSMNHIEWHTAFDPEAGSYGCSKFNNNSTYYYNSNTTKTYCSNKRVIYAPYNSTRWSGAYLNWYFSDAADPYINEIETAKAPTAGCTKAGGSAQFGNMFRRTRFEAAKQVLLDLLCFAEPKGVRFGLAQFRVPGSDNDPNGGFVSVPIERSNPNQAADLEATLKNTDAESWTPVAETLFQTYTYFMSRTTADIPYGRKPDGTVTTTQFPRYQYEKDGDYTTNSNKWVEDPIEWECQKSFIILVTDGEPTRDDFDVNSPSNTAQGFSNFDKLIGDYNQDGQTEDPFFCCGGTAYLDDIAKFMQDNDSRPDLAGDQVIDTYTIGFSTTALADSLLKKAADVGNGLFYHTQTGEELGAALVSSLNDIIEKSQSFTAASVPSARTADGGDFYQSYFFPLGSSAFWEGHLRAWHITPGGDITDKFGLCALDDLDPGECNSGPFKASATYFWDAADEMPAPGSRNLGVSKLVAGVPMVVSFDDTLTAADLNISPFTAAPDPAPNSALYPLAGSTALTAEGLADETIAYARGCLFGTGAATNVATPAACIERTSTLGDVFHSDPAVVRGVRALHFTPDHEAFRAVYGKRSRVLYAGTNGGFLHAFDAGSWQSLPLPGRYLEGSGQEIWGFMPWQARKKIKNLSIADPLLRDYYVDGGAQYSDVWLHPTSTTVGKAIDGSEWRTMLVGGFRQGGQHYYALDITNPDGIVGPAGNLPYPAYLWEFPNETDPDNAAIATSQLPFMGETWGVPIVTRIKLKVGLSDNGGAGYERWVAIVTGGMAATGDPNDVGNYDPNALQGRAIYVLDIKTGQVIAEKRFDSGAGDATKDMTYAIPATPSVIDWNGDGFADMVYVGDIGGNVWKWTINAVGEDRVNDSSGLRTQPNWPFKKFFQAPVAKVSGVDYYKPIFYSPAAGRAGNKLWLAFGTGQRNNLGELGITNTTNENNRFYVVIDTDPFEMAPITQPTVVESDLTDVSGTENATSFANRGYYFKAADGEKFVTNVEIFAGTVLAATFTPESTGNPCTSRGDATLYAFSLTTGRGYFDASGSPTRTEAMGAGLPTDPKTSAGPDGKLNRVYIEKSGTDMFSIEASDLDLTGGGVYWREVTK